MPETSRLLGLSLAAFVAAGAWGCGSGGGAISGAATTTTTGAADTGTGGSSSSGGASSGGTSAASTGTSGSTGAGPICGNGVVDPGEGCDDGNTVSGDGCNAECELGGAPLWEKTVDRGDADEEVRAIGVDGTGRPYVAGHDGAGNGGTIWVSARTLDGEERWSWTRDGNGADEVFDMAVTSEGAVYVAGRVAEVPPVFRAWVAKLDPEGGLLWERTFAGDPTGGAAAYGIAQRPGGGVVVGGMLVPSGGDPDLWVQVVDADGTPQASRTIDASGAVDLVTAVDVAPDGRIGACGLIGTPGTRVSVLAEDLSDGWHRDFDAPATFGCAFDDEGAIFVSGQVDVGPLRVGYLRRYRTDGTLAWERYLPFEADNAATGVATDILGNAVVTGAAPPEASAAPHPILIKYAGSGDLVWQRMLEGDAGWGWAVATAAPAVFVAGTRTTAAGGDFWFAAYTP